MGAGRNPEALRSKPQPPNYQTRAEDAKWYDQSGPSSRHAIKPLYARLVTGFGADALAAVKDRTCQHCHTAITIQQQHEIESGRFVTCRSCGRGLYLPE